MTDGEQDAPVTDAAEVLVGQTREELTKILADARRGRMTWVAYGQQRVRLAAVVPVHVGVAWQDGLDANAAILEQVAAEVARFEDEVTALVSALKESIANLRGQDAGQEER